MKSAPTQPGIPSLRLALTALVCLACAALPGCSKIYNVLFINRFDQNIQIKLGMSKTAVPANSHTFAEERQSVGYDMPLSIYGENGSLIRSEGLSYDGRDKYQDDLLVVDVGP